MKIIRTKLTLHVGSYYKWRSSSEFAGSSWRTDGPDGMIMYVDEKDLPFDWEIVEALYSCEDK